jgi:hypothetical protein
LIAASPSIALLVSGEALDAGAASAASIVDRQGLLGGVTPAPFVATEAISHGLGTAWRRALNPSATA